MMALPTGWYAPVDPETERQLLKIEQYIEVIRRRAKDEEKIPESALEVFDKLIAESGITSLSNDPHP